MTEAAATAEAVTPGAANEAAATGSRGESFRDAMERLGGDEVFEDPGPRVAKQEAEKAATAELGTPEGEKPAEAAKPSPTADLDAFRAMAKKLGFNVEDAAVTNKERAEWRRMRKEHTDAIRAAEAEATSKIGELQKTTEAEISFGKALREARKSNDYNQIAKLLEYDDWNALQEGVANAVTDPAYQEVLELKAWKAQQEKAEADRQEQARIHGEQQQKIVKQNEYRQNLSMGMKASTDPLVKAFADDPMFVNVVFQVQEQNWDGGAEVLTPERAIHVKPQGAKFTLHDELKGLFERLAPVFGAKAEPEVETLKPKRAPPSPKGNTGPSKPGREDDREWSTRFRADMERAIAEDKRAERAGNGARKTG